MVKKIFSASLTLILASVLAFFSFGQQGNAAPASKYFAYVANSGGNGSISAYSINSTTGVLNEIKGSPFPTGIAPTDIVIHPNGKFLYVINSESDNISVYTINALTGALSQIKGSPFSLTSSSGSITMAPTGKFIYASNLDGIVSIYSINPTNGTLTAIKGSPFNIQKKLTGVAFEPLGKLALTTDYSRNSIFTYSINDQTGTLTKIKETLIKSGKNPNSISIHPNGKFAFIPNIDTENLSIYSINIKTGTLTELKDSPFNIGRSSNPIFTSSGKFAYTLRYTSVDAYSFNPVTGKLTEIKNGGYEGFSDSNRPVSLTIDPNNKYLYVTNSKDDLIPDSSNTIYAFSISQNTGKLTKIQGSPFKAGDKPGTIITVKK